MPLTTISCPHCHTPIDIDALVLRQSEATVSAKFQASLAEKDKQSQLLLAQLEKMKKDQEKAQQLAEEKQAQILKKQEQKIKQDLWQKAQEEAIKRASSLSEKELNDLKQQLHEQKERALSAEKTELELRKKQRELEDKSKQMDLELERQLDQRLQQEKEKSLKQEAERFSLKEKEYMKQIDDMKKLVEEATRKASSVSQQLQGEVLELQLEQTLREAFPGDSITEVKKGQLGADIIHTVKNGQGRQVGIIVWESKQTREFSEKWLSKLREDCRACHGSLAVLVSKTLPDSISVCGEMENVWVTGIEFVIPLAQLLRQTLMSVEQVKQSQQGKEIKSEMLYQYINSHEFRGRVEGIVESFREMQEDLEREQRALQNIWKKREKQILRLATNTAYMYGEMQGIVGRHLPAIHGLDIDPVAELAAPNPSLFSE